MPEDQVQHAQRHAGIMSDPRLPLVSDPGPTSGTPQATDRRYLGETTMALLTSPPGDEKVATPELMSMI
jgi:hypothetical protein